MVDRILQMNLQPSLASTPSPCAPRRAGRLVAWLALVALLGACGQKGPLTLPQPPASAASAAAPK